ncbi:hypothetical protein F4820DRAFT_451897 [Hypoxylon rubiginosum]|uniref:Uncharacterized protein n=1 Tax=Hypoxylon rubiginosum TaxID=110542 RepID=A0ACB9YQG5_9PEZI|nr:hypothetical protein F4820DRAFT_451897 [Hypoxylon rubiginosum]
MGFDPHKGYPVRLAGQGLILVLALANGYGLFRSLCLGLGIESCLWSHYDLISTLCQYIAEFIRSTPLAISPQSRLNLKKEEKAASHSPDSNDKSNSAASFASRPKRLEQWHLRWNNDWYNDAVPQQIRKDYAYVMRYRHSTRHTKRDIRRWRAGQEEEISAAISGGYVDPENTLSCSRWQRARDRVLEFGPMKPLGCLKQGYDDFKEWRRERTNRDKVWKMTAFMEDIGDKPRWKAELTFKVSAEEISRLRKSGKWFEFPSAENIKWWWVKGPNGSESLPTLSVRHW